MNIRKLDIIQAGLNVKTVVNELETITKKLGEVYITEIDKTEQPSTNQCDLKEILTMCKSISDIEVRFPELRYSEEKGKIVCSVCDGEISYPVDEERDFRDKKSQSMKFRQLKYKISLHVKRNNHLKNISTSKAKEDIEHKEACRNKKLE